MSESGAQQEVGREVVFDFLLESVTKILERYKIQAATIEKIGLKRIIKEFLEGRNFYKDIHELVSPETINILVNKFICEEGWLTDMESVGQEKPVGNMPIGTLEDDLQKNLEEIIKHFKDKGLEAKVFINPEPPNYKGTLCVYDKAALQKILDTNRQILLQANWPTEADEFVANLHIVQEKFGTPVYKVIAKAFGNK